MVRARKKAKKGNEQRSNSTKIAALNMIKSGTTQVKVCKDLNIPERTLRHWKKESQDAGLWKGSAGDSKARPAKRRSDPGSGTRNRKLTEELRAKILSELETDPFLTPFGLQEKIPGLRNIAKSTIRHCINSELKIPSRSAAKKPFVTED